MTKIRTYSELNRLNTFEDRFNYLVLGGEVGVMTFGFDRYLNQKFYTSTEWRQLRNHIIARDAGCDLGLEGHETFKNLTIHHMNPMRVEDVVEGNDDILNPEYLIATTQLTHNAIHYGNINSLPKPWIPRSRNDTRLW